MKAGMAPTDGTTGRADALDAVTDHPPGRCDVGTIQPHTSTFPEDQRRECPHF